MLDWLIIGGGIHGTHLAHVLIHQCGFSADAVRILDPHDRLLATWSKRTENTGMRFLRSPRVHNIDIGAHSLQYFVQEHHPDDDAQLWTDPYYRPSLTLFQQHCQHVIDTYQLERLHIRGKALALHRINNGWCVETAGDRLTTRRVLLATGRQQLQIPDWAEQLIVRNAPIQHVLDMSFDRHQIKIDSTVLVIGGGISAGQIAYKLMNDHAVTLVTRHTLSQLDFDSSPCWLGPGCLEAFGKANYSRRRWMIGEARHPGTLAQDTYKELKKAIQEKQLSYQQDSIVFADMTSDNRITLQFASGTISIVDHIVLATGLKSERPAHTWLADTLIRYNLPVADCGYPILDRTLCWSDGLYATGTLAELELGPAAANIAGARAAAERLRQMQATN